MAEDGQEESRPYAGVFRGAGHLQVQGQHPVDH